MLTLKVVEGKRTCRQTVLSTDLTTIGDMHWLEEYKFVAFQSFNDS